MRHASHNVTTQRDGQVPAIEHGEGLSVAHGDRAQQVVVGRVRQIHFVGVAHDAYEMNSMRLPSGSRK